MYFTAMYIVAFHSRTCGILNNYAGSEYILQQIKGSITKQQFKLTLVVLLPITFAAMNFSCIANADQLCALLQDIPAGQWNPENIKSFLLFHMHIHMAASQDSSNATSHLEDMCCEVSDTQDICSTTAVYSRPIFEYFPYLLLKVFLFSIKATTLLDYFTSGVKPTALGNSIEEKCWTPPLPFCPNTSTSTNTIVQGAISQVKNHIQYIDHMHAKTSMIFSTVPNCVLMIILLYSG